ncbi:MAG TPA: CapA family protein [Burkholderiales bacterium]|nr:CapA family protein [Burkholderiales bacterium]
MKTTLMFTGDINLMNVTDAEGPFAKVADVLRQADVRFSNLECCFYQPEGARSVSDEGFYANPAVAKALRIAGIDAVGTANNVNYGADAITSSLKALDSLGIPHTGSGANSTAAHEPVVVTAKNEVKVGFLQRTSVYWPTNHEAGEHSPGVAALRGHTAYRVPAHKTRPEIPPMNRPGVPPEVITWADAGYLKRLREDIQTLRKRCDIVVASHHWGLHQDVLQYMTEIAHAAIDAGADVVIGHGPHYSLPVEIYQGKPIFYGLGSFSFHTGHYGRKHGDWVGMLARVVIEDGKATEAAFRLVRHNDANETYVCDPAKEEVELGKIEKRTTPLGAKLGIKGDEVTITLA